MDAGTGDPSVSTRRYNIVSSTDGLTSENRLQLLDVDSFRWSTHSSSKAKMKHGIRFDRDAIAPVLPQVNRG